MNMKPVLRDILMLLGVGAAALGLVCVTPAQETTSITSESASSRTSVVPPLVRYSGGVGNRAGDTVEAIFSVYSAPKGGEPIWGETQQIAIGQDGKYSILLGAVTQDGIPAAVFAGGEGRWLGVSIERAPEQTRTQLVSVAYAMKAGDADTLGGLTVSDLVTRAELAQTARQMAAQAAQLAGPAPQLAPTGAGTTGFVPLWTSSAALGDSILFEGGTQAAPMLGDNTAKPTQTLDVAGNSNFRGTLYVNTTTSATATSAVNSPMIVLQGKSYLSTGGKSVSQAFGWQTVAANNNTASPSANLVLAYGMLGATPTPTGLEIAPSGVITFAPNQPYPGTITSVEPGIGLTGGGTSGDVMLTVDTGLVPLMNRANNYTAAQNFTSGMSVTGNDTITGSLTVNGPAAFSNNASGATVSVIGGSNSAGPVLAAYNGLVGVGASGSHNGVQGYSSASTFVANEYGSGVQGTGPAGLAGYGTSFGVYATSSAAGGFGVSADASGAGSIGVQAQGFTGLRAIGVGTNSTGINATGVANGVTATAGASTGIGVHGLAQGGSNTAAYLRQSAPIESIGVWGDSNVPWPRQGGYTGAVLATADDNIAFLGYNQSTDMSTLDVSNFGSGPSGDAVPVIHARGHSGDCMINSHGDSICSGAHAAAVSIDGGAHQVEMYAVHAAENWFEDFGMGKLEAGVTVVKIDPAFSATVNGEMDYEVFLTPRGDCDGLYVSNQTATSFEVHELRKGTASVAFNYRITARRAGHEAERMRDVTEQMKADAPRKMPAQAAEDEQR